MEAVAEVEAVVSEGVRLLEARSDAFAVETRPGEIWITGELAILGTIHTLYSLSPNLNECQ